ncbi:MULTISPECIES: hypothetical protein [unclassified Leptolyngbya]|uniref:hypothetical protein n=1 Tax=unclassified Leptolyngbya TaxID=2650499 RepID=UPI0018F02612|nr:MULTISPECIES: hypothetical protein [unclassified Leptolyngbya]
MNASRRAGFQMANDCFRKAAHARWHRQQSKLHILRSQLGFREAENTRPLVCQDCIHYHGIAYGCGENRAMLICGFYPLGWDGDLCPEWCGPA